MVARDRGVELAQEKAQFARLAESIPLRWSDAGVLMPSDPIAATPEPSHDAADANSVLRAIDAAAEAGVQVADARTGPATAQRTLETFAELPSALRGRKGRDRFWNAIGALRQAGKIVVEDRWSPSRHPRRCILPLSHSQVSDRAQSPTPPAGGTRETRDAVSGFAPFASSQQTRETGETRENIDAAIHASSTDADAYRRARDGEL